MKELFRVQNLSVICQDDQIEYYAKNNYEYDVIKDFLEKIKQESEKRVKFLTNVPFGNTYIHLGSCSFLVVHIEKNKKHNPYFAMYDSRENRISIVADINQLNPFLHEDVQYIAFDSIATIEKQSPYEEMPDQQMKQLAKEIDDLLL